MAKHKVGRGVVISRGYVYVRFWPRGSKDAEGKSVAPTIKHFGVANKLNIAKAEEWLANERKLAKDDRYIDPKTVRTIKVSEALNIFWEGYGKFKKSASTYEVMVNTLKKELGDEWWHLLSPEHVIAYRTKRELTVKPSSVNKEQSILSCCFNTLYLWGTSENKKLPYPIRFPHFNPAGGKVAPKKSETDYRRKFALTKKQFQMLYRAATPRLKEILQFALRTGLRKKDLMELSHRNYNLAQQSIRGTQNKTDREYWVPIDQTLAKIIAAKPKGKPFLDFTNFKREFLTACKEAGLDSEQAETGEESFQFRDLRRTCGTWMNSNGIGREVIRGHLGHASQRQTETYLSLSNPEHKAAVNVFDRILK